MRITYVLQAPAMYAELQRQLAGGQVSCVYMTWWLECGSCSLRGVCLSAQPAALTLQVQIPC